MSAVEDRQREAELLARISRGVLASDRRAEETPRDRVLLYDSDSEDAELAGVVEDIGGGRRRIRTIERDSQKRIVAVRERVEHGHPDLERAADLRAFAARDAAHAESRAASRAPAPWTGQPRSWPG